MSNKNRYNTVMGYMPDSELFPKRPQTNTSYQNGVREEREEEDIYDAVARYRKEHPEEMIKPPEWPGKRETFLVYRKRWWGDSLFYECEDIKADETTVFLFVGNAIVAILPLKDFSYAIKVR